MNLVKHMKSSPLIPILRSKVISNLILHALKVKTCQKLLESAIECKQVYASIFKNFVSIQDLDNKIKYFSLTNNYL